MLQIIRYLKGTKHLGTTLTPSRASLTLDCYANADFAGHYKIDDEDKLHLMVLQLSGEAASKLKQPFPPWRLNTLL
jgi:hypothetical protein